MPPMVTIVLFIIREDLGSIIISNKGGFQKMKKTKGILTIMIVCMVLCGVNTGIETCGQIGKDTIGVLSYTSNIDEY